MKSETKTRLFWQSTIAKGTGALTLLFLALPFLMLVSCGGEGGNGGGDKAASGETVRAKLTLWVPTTAAGPGGGDRQTGPVSFTSPGDDSEAGGCGSAPVEAGDFKPRRFGFDDDGQDVWAIEVTKACPVAESDVAGTYGVTYGDFSATCEVDGSDLWINFSVGKEGCATGKSNFP